jgi:F-type H+-transporting ATPase subunit alpha
MDKVPVERIREFEKEFIERMKMRHGALLASIAEKGVMDDEVVEALKKEAADLADLYSEKETA